MLRNMIKRIIPCHPLWSLICVSRSWKVLESQTLMAALQLQDCEDNEPNMEDLTMNQDYFLINIKHELLL